MSDIRYRRFEPRDRDSVLRLFKDSFGKPKDVTQWEWEFLGGPKPAIIVVAEVEGRIVGHYAVLPRRILVGHEVVESGLVVDVMTHPDFGKRGIFVNSGLEAFRQTRASGIRMLMGFPNDAAIRGHLKIGWRELGNVAVIARPLRIRSIVKMAGDRLKLPGPMIRFGDALLRCLNNVSLGSTRDDIEVEWTGPEGYASLGGEIEPFLKKCVSEHLVANSRDGDWYSWRVRDPSGTTLIGVFRSKRSRDVQGFAVLRIKERDGVRTGAIMDMLAPREAVDLQRRMLQEMLRKALSEECELLIVLGSPAAQRGKALSRMLMFRTPKKLRYIVRSTDDEKLPDLVLSLENWHIELIDHDVI
jgi:hypothetical protein